jgi:hypothetical protein
VALAGGVAGVLAAQAPASLAFEVAVSYHVTMNFDMLATGIGSCSSNGDLALARAAAVGFTAS